MNVQPFTHYWIGITGGFAPPRPSAVHDLALDPSSDPTSIFLSSAIRDDGTPSLQSHPPKHVKVSADTDALIDELQTILRRLPTENPPSADIYRRDIGIFWQGDGFEWVNAAPQGCGGFDSSVNVTDDDRKAFDRAVDIVEELVKKGVAKEA